jgi:hypothetical protein
VTALVTRFFHFVEIVTKKGVPEIIAWQVTKQCPAACFEDGLDVPHLAASVEKYEREA